MSFEQEMRNVLRTKAEVEDEATKKLRQEAYEWANRTFGYIKEGLLREANAGRFEIIGGTKFFRYLKDMYPYSDLFVYDVEDTSIYRKKTRFYNGPLYEFHNVVKVTVNHERKKVWFMEELNRLCNLDNIYIKLCLKNEKNGKILVPPCTLYDEGSFLNSPTGKGTWFVYIEVSYSMP